MSRVHSLLPAAEYFDSDWLHALHADADVSPLSVEKNPAGHGRHEEDESDLHVPSGQSAEHVEAPTVETLSAGQLSHATAVETACDFPGWQLRQSSPYKCCPGLQLQTASAMEPPEVENMEAWEALLVIQFTPQSECAKLVAELNMYGIVMTLETSQLETS